MFDELIEKERTALNNFFDRFDKKQMDSLIPLILQKEGLLFFTGVGKSGLIAKKISQTMTSTGTKSLYISPLDALHGDIGIVTNKDIFFLISKSGETEELLNLLPILRNKEVVTVAIVSEKESKLGSFADHQIFLPCKHELCPFDMAPTISCTIQMIFGDLLAIALMRQRNFSENQFVENHPAGRIGKRMNLKVKDLMIKESKLPICNRNNKLVDLLVELSDKRSGCLLVTDQNQHLEGIFTDGDLKRSLLKFGEVALQKPISELMTIDPKSIGLERLANEAMKMMESDHKKAITVLPVVGEGKKVVGLIRLHDILQSGI